MSAEDEVIDATWHPDAQYMRFREGNAVRGQLQPADSILYRTITDVPKVPESDDILDWCMASWEKPFLSVSAAGWETHDAAADTPENAALGQPGFYLDEAPLVPAKRNMELSNPSAPYKSTGPVQQDLLFKWTNDYFPARTERRVKAGHARSQYSVLFPGNVKPFHPVDNDRATLTIWPSLRITTETVSTDWAGITKDSRVGSYTQRSWDSNAWPRYWDPTKPGNLGSYAGAASSGLPMPLLMYSYDELLRGWVNHIGMMAVQGHTSGNVTSGPGLAHWPSIRSDGNEEFSDGSFEAGGPYGGHVFRLKASIDVRDLSDDPLKQTLLRGFQQHGLILSDTHGSKPGAERPAGENRPVNVLVANHPSFGEDFEFPGGSRSSYTPGAMGPLVLEDGAIPLSKDYWEVLSLRAYQKLDPAKTRASVYPALDQNGTPILNQDHWQCIMPGGS